MMSKAIQVHIQNIFNQLSKFNYQPTFQIQHQVISVLKLSSEAKKNLQFTLKNIQALRNQISEQDLLKDHYLSQRINKNSTMIQMLRFSNNIIKQIQQFTKTKKNLPQSNLNRHQKNSQNQYFANLQDQFNIFSILLSNIKIFDDYLNQKVLNLNPIDNQEFTLQNVKKLKQKFYQDIWNRIIQNEQQKKKNSQMISHLCKKYKLPLSRNEDPKQTINKNQREKKKQDVINVLRILHSEACKYTLSIFLNKLLEVDQLFKYQSLFYDTYFLKLSKSIDYLFCSQGESHNVEQPQWMFQYIHQSFKNNYIYLRQFFMQNLNEEIKTNMTIFTLQYNAQHLFLVNIITRLQKDFLPMFQPTQILKKKQLQAFLCFNFLDQLSQLQEQLNITFSQQFNFIEPILNIFVIQKKTPFLQLNFDYEHKWIQQKIFQDFYNINYSKIDLKNIEAYNIVVNYCVLFQKLYSKFKGISNPLIIQKIVEFYHQSIINLMAHIKSSLQKIYQNSGLKKIDIILAYKRVQNQFKSGLSGFIGQSIQFQTKIKTQYYDFLQAYFNLYALQQLSPLHRKLIRLINQNQKNFSNLFHQTQKQILKNKNHSISEEWQHKLSQLNKLYGYTDLKMKNIFFTFMESTQFTQPGISAFLQVFQPYLKIIYSIQGFGIIKMIAIMDKAAFQEYNAVYCNRLTFLTQSQIKCLKNVRIKFS